jgi:hypothetical protein
MDSVPSRNAGLALCSLGTGAPPPVGLAFLRSTAFNGGAVTSAANPKADCYASKTKAGKKVVLHGRH